MRKIGYVSLWLLLSCCFGSQAAPKPRIMALSPHIVEMLFEVGAGDQIIATTDFANYPEAARAIPRVGNYARIQIEKVIELNPDLILAWKTGNPEDDLDRLRQLGYTVVYSHPLRLEDIAKEIEHFAQLAGHGPAGKKVAQAYLTQLSTIKATYQNRAGIKVFYELWSQPLSTIAKDAWPQRLLEVCHAENPFIDAANSYPQIGIEQVLVHDAQLIIQPLSVDQTDKKGFAWQNWPALTAVKHQQIIHPDADSLHRMTPRLLTELDKLCRQIDNSRRYYQALANNNGQG